MVAALVLGWAVFVEREMVAPVLSPIVSDESNNDTVSDDEVDISSDVEDNDILEVDDSDWKTYTTPVYLIKYPDTWNADKAAPLEKITNIWIQPQNIKGNYPRVSIQYFDLRKTSTTLKLQKGLIMTRKHISKEESTVLIDNISAWKLSGKLDEKNVNGARQDGIVQNSVVILECNDDEFFIIDFQYEGEKNINLEKVFKTMILSFRFL